MGRPDMVKKATAKKTVKKAATKKTAPKKTVPKKSAVKKTAVKKTIKKKTVIKAEAVTKKTSKKVKAATPEKRMMIAMHAYYKWENAGRPSNNETRFWLEAEKDIDEMLNK